jgi:hypothetical protein
MSTPNNSIAIDIALLPPDDIMELCRSINDSLWQETKQGYRFSDTFLPHITLFQCFIQPQRLDALNNELQRQMLKT